jgi:hypothetical protein
MGKKIKAEAASERAGLRFAGEYVEALALRVTQSYEQDGAFDDGATVVAILGDGRDRSAKLPSHFYFSGDECANPECVGSPALNWAAVFEGRRVCLECGVERPRPEDEQLWLTQVG